jgi:hypothetical protein
VSVYNNYFEMINDILTTNLRQLLNNLSHKVLLVFLNNFLFVLIYVSIFILPYMLLVVPWVVHVYNTPLLKFIPVRTYPILYRFCFMYSNYFEIFIT